MSPDWDFDDATFVARAAHDNHDYVDVVIHDLPASPSAFAAGDDEYADCSAAGAAAASLSGGDARWLCGWPSCRQRLPPPAPKVHRPPCSPRVRAAQSAPLARKLFAGGGEGVGQARGDRADLFNIQWGPSSCEGSRIRPRFPLGRTYFMRIRTIRGASHTECVDRGRTQCAPTIIARGNLSVRTNRQASHVDLRDLFAACETLAQAMRVGA